jgi:hypothetical protein
MGDGWKQVLANQVDVKSAGVVARELGISTTTVSLVLSGKYGASTDNIERKVIAIYGEDGQVDCQQLGVKITPAKCVENWELAKKIGIKASNPAKIRLFKACLKCRLRNG